MWSITQQPGRAERQDPMIDLKSPYIGMAFRHKSDGRYYVVQYVEREGRRTFVIAEEYGSDNRFDYTVFDWDFLSQEQLICPVVA